MWDKETIKAKVAADDLDDEGEREVDKKACYKRSWETSIVIDIRWSTSSRLAVPFRKGAARDVDRRLALCITSSPSRPPTRHPSHPFNCPSLFLSPRPFLSPVLDQTYNGCCILSLHL
jgi:hypothetical protein